MSATQEGGPPRRLQAARPPSSPRKVVDSAFCLPLYLLLSVTHSQNGAPTHRANSCPPLEDRLEPFTMP